MTNRITGLNSGMDTESLITALTSTYQTHVDKATGGQQKLQWKQDAWKSLNKEIVSLYNGKLSNMRFSTAYNKKTTTASSNAISVTTGDNAMIATQKYKVDSVASSAYLTGGKVTDSSGKTASNTTTLSSLGIKEDDTLSLQIGDDASDTISVKVGAGDTMQDVIDRLKSAKSSKTGTSVSVNFDETQGRMYIASKSTGAASSFSIASSNSSSVLNAFGLGDTKNYSAGTDAKMTLNGVEYTSDSNNFSINGLTIAVNSTTEGEETLTTKSDTSGIYDTIKDFFKEYNTLINKMDSLYNASSAKSYDVLTKDQRSELTDDEVKEWNEKIKSGLLSKDDTLYSISSAMKQALSTSLNVTNSNGEKVTASLSDFGINTLSYFSAKDNERYAYHIDGDSDDESTSGNTDKLSAMIATDPDLVTNFFTELSKKLYSSMGNLMKSTSYSSAYTVYEDKLMASQYSDYTDQITKAQKALEAKQDYYYKKFSTMETALAKLNSNSSSLSGMLGS